jgi:hypothetical protein
MKFPPRRFFDVIGGFVLRPRVFDFYTFASYIHAIAEFPDQNDLNLTGNTEAIEALSRTDIGLTVFGMDEFCTTHLPKAVERAKYLHDEINDIFGRNEKPPQMRTLLYAFQVKDLKERVHAFETSLQDELDRLPIFCCEEDHCGNLSITKLLKGASNGYPQAVKEKLTPEAVIEIDEAGRCLALDRNTASGFHILRSVELTIRQYLIGIPGFVMPPLNRQNWGEYLDLLKSNGAAREVTDHLYNIKDNYRNPLMHPQDNLDADGAVSLFAVAQSMNEMLIKDAIKKGLIK